MKAASGRIRRFHYWSKAMTLEQEQALKAHLKAIAQILYDDSDPEEMKTLEGIELTVRQQIQAHVSPELGSFLSKQLQERKQVSEET
jgi:hypothetical protein